MTIATDRTTFRAPLQPQTSSLRSAIEQLTTDDQLGLLWEIYRELGRSITPAAPGAARISLVEGLLGEFKQMSSQQQLQAMRDLIERRDTPISRAYGALSVNTKLGFWYLLAERMGQDIVPVPDTYHLPEKARLVLNQIQMLDFGQQITLLRQVVVDMGVDPLNLPLRRYSMQA